MKIVALLVLEAAHNTCHKSYFTNKQMQILLLNSKKNSISKYETINFEKIL